MSVSFLYPLFWLGALAAAAPIWLHLRRRAESSVVRFSALEFLDHQPPARRRFLRLQDLLLLAMRVAALLLVVAGFAWPFVQDQEAGSASESRVYILDNTLSHQADGGFQTDRTRIAEQLANTARETQIAVVELTALPRVVVGFEDTREDAARKLASLDPSHQRGSYLAAFRRAKALLDHSLGQRRRILLYGDSQENQWAKGMSTVPFLEDVEVDLPEVTTSRPNLAVSQVEAHRRLFGDKSVIACTVELHHQGSAREAAVTFVANGKAVLRREVDLVGQPDAMRLLAEWETDSTAAVRGEVRVDGEPDALAGDNRVFFSLPPVREGKVVVLARSRFVRAALSPEIMRGRWSARTLETSSLAEEIRAEKYADVLCVEGTYLQWAEVRDLALRYLNNGRGVLLLVDRPSPLVAAFLRDFGIEVLPEAATPPMAERFRYIFTEHPIFAPFRSPDFGSLTDVKVYRYRRLRAEDALPLVFSWAGDPLLVEALRSKGRLLVSAFGFDRSDTNWPLEPTFVPFLDLCLKHAWAEERPLSSFQPGEVGVIGLRGEGAGGEAVLRQGGRELVRAPVTNGRVQLRLPDEPGLYTLFLDGRSKTAETLSVNPAPEESLLKYQRSPQALLSWRRDTPAGRGGPRRTGSEVELTRLEILDQGLWWWLMVAGLAALALETILGAAREVRP